ncbi:MAG: biotin--[acetyl-CoA-carboxylase] ligase [Actinomycetota bacterium]
MDANDLSQDALATGLPPWIRQVRFFQEVDSTNRVAGTWAMNGAGHGSVVVADYQSHGRGRLGRTWLSPKGTGLLFTVILRPKLARERFGLINLAAASALCRAFVLLGLDPKVKWPNDVQIGGKKVSGIASKVSGDAVCLGIGVNVNQTAFPDEIAGTATSLRLETGQPHDRAAIMARILEALDLTPEQILPSFRPWCVTLGSPVRVSLSSGTIEGVACDVDASGALIMCSGEVISAGDVVHLHQGGVEAR